MGRAAPAPNVAPDPAWLVVHGTRRYFVRAKTAQAAFDEFNQQFRKLTHGKFTLGEDEVMIHQATEEELTELRDQRARNPYKKQPRSQVRAW